MPEYLSKEEVRQWRSSLERITLEEFAARLGKVIQGEKQTNDMVDKVMTRSLNSMPAQSYNSVKTEKIQTIAIKSFEKEKELTKEKTDVKQKAKQDVKVEIKVAKPAEKKSVAKEVKKEAVEVATKTVAADIENFNLTFKKSLTPREQVIFDHFFANRNTIVYAKDLAKLLDLPRDYVYKYIKNLRSKLNEDALYNADNGGYVLKV